MNHTIQMKSIVPTLFNSPTGGPESISAGTTGVVGIPSDWTHTSRIGTRFGPRALRQSTTELLQFLLNDSNSEFVDPNNNDILQYRFDEWLVDCGDAVISPASVEKTTESIASMTYAIRSRGAFPLALGGDHYNSYPACLGYARGLDERHPGRSFGYIHIDGHLDFSDRLGAWGKYNHATNARRISELPNIVKSNMVWIGITGWVDSGELELIESMGGKIFSSKDVHRLGAKKVAQLALQHATRGSESLYVTIDIDAMDAGFLPGTGSIVHSGITPRQYCQILDVLSTAPIDGLDIVEVSPPLDPSGRTERIAAHLLFHILRNRMFTTKN